MDLRRFVDLYVAETHENIRLLQRSLVALETDATDAAIAEAFRAAHTLKGISAAMGYTTVADMAHRLEDRLDGIRAGTLSADGAVVDALLAAADELEDAIGDAIRTGPSPVDGAAAPGAGAETRTGSSAPAPAGTVLIAHVRLRADAPIKSARASLVMRALGDAAGILGSDPEQFDDDFDGYLRIFLAASADAAAAESAIRSAGEVDTVEIAAPVAGPAPEGTGNGMSTAPVRQVRVDARRLDGLADGLGELSVLYARLQRAGVPTQVGDMVDRLGTVLGELDHEMRALRMVPVREVFERLPRVMRDAARSVGRDVDLVLEGDDVELDRSILDEIGEPLVHLLRNAVDHGIESPADRRRAGKPPRGRIRVSAERERGSVRIVIEDDGRGVSAERMADKARSAGVYDRAEPPATDEELFRLMSMPGLSTASEVSAVSGRGVGMDVVVNRVRALGGAIDMRTNAGTGTTFRMRLPNTLAVAQALRIRVGGEDYAIPLTHVSEAIELDEAALNGAGDLLRVRSYSVPLVRLRRVLRVQAEGRESAAVIAEIGDRRAALAVDELVGREQILVRTFDAVRGMLPFFSGATLLADGRPALVLDPLSMI
ncbi:MAG TPA: chemotaxis protein CheW [Longimicrobiales bacterium]|nr:chemotaxis protein CheW [Longimicrobiales bacterium]